MKLECECGFDTDNLDNLYDVKRDLEDKSGKEETWYEDDYENRCPQCGQNELKLIED